jgi:hypothetical protein
MREQLENPAKHQLSEARSDAGCTAGRETPAGNEAIETR